MEMAFSVYFMTWHKEGGFVGAFGTFLVTSESIWLCFETKWTEPVFVAVSNLALVKPDKAKAVENYLIQMARFGQIPGKVSYVFLSHVYSFPNLIHSKKNCMFLISVN